MTKGFTLIELSIVIVIIGLIAGGLTVGQDLIRATELNSLIREVNQYKTAINTFNLKYNYLPGDMPNATDYWGNADTGGAGGECSNPRSDVGINTETCNGDGNGQIGIWWTAHNAHNESFRAWQHLANAELISGSFSGIEGSFGHLDAIIGENVPSSKINGAGFSIVYLGNITTSMDYFEGKWSNVLVFGSTRENTNIHTGLPSLTPEAANSIDTKMDDGRPGYGNVRGLKKESMNPNCTTTNAKETSKWNLGNQDKLCSLNFPNL